MDTQKVAIKKMRTGLIEESEDIETFVQEVTLLSSVNHPCIVTFIGYVTYPALLIVMDFINGGLVNIFSCLTVRVFNQAKLIGMC